VFPGNGGGKIEKTEVRGEGEIVDRTAYMRREGGKKGAKKKSSNMKDPKCLPEVRQNKERACITISQVVNKYKTCKNKLAGLLYKKQERGAKFKGNMWGKRRNRRGWLGAGPLVLTYETLGAKTREKIQHGDRKKGQEGEKGARRGCSKV